VQPTAGKAKFTPGPWRKYKMTMTPEDWASLCSGEYPITIVRRGQDVIAAVWADGDEEEQANAHLIAAAPEMYEALEDGRERLIKIAAILNGGELTPAKRREAYTLAYDGKQTAALAKARGETP